MKKFCRGARANSPLPVLVFRKTVKPLAPVTSTSNLLSLFRSTKYTSEWPLVWPVAESSFAANDSGVNTSDPLKLVENFLDEIAVR